MTDLHTHILPYVDDGSHNVATSIQMLQMEKEQGVDTVALTPHFYPARERCSQFLARRDEAYRRLLAYIEQLPEEKKQKLPHLILGAEVAWVSGLCEQEGLNRLCYGGGEYLLLELPFEPWTEGMFRQLYELINGSGITPVIAHIDRYLGIQSQKNLHRLYDFNFPTQISGAALTHCLQKRKGVKLLDEGRAQFIISDCHGTIHRAPNLAGAYRTVESRLGQPFGDALRACSDRLLQISWSHGNGQA